MPCCGRRAWSGSSSQDGHRLHSTSSRREPCNIAIANVSTIVTRIDANALSPPPTQAAAHAADVVQILLKAGADKHATSSGGHKVHSSAGCVNFVRNTCSLSQPDDAMDAQTQGVPTSEKRSMGCLIDTTKASCERAVPAAPNFIWWPQPVSRRHIHNFWTIYSNI